MVAGAGKTTASKPHTPHTATHEPKKAGFDHAVRSAGGGAGGPSQAPPHTGPHAGPTPARHATPARHPAAGPTARHPAAAPTRHATTPAARHATPAARHARPATAHDVPPARHRAPHRAEPGTPGGAQPAAAPAPASSTPASPATPGQPGDAPTTDTKLRAVATRPGTYSQQTHETVTSAVAADAELGNKTAQVAGLNGSTSPAAVRSTDDLNTAQQSWHDSWGKAHDAISADLSAQGNGKLDADALVHPTLRAINNIAPHSATLRAATLGVYAERVKSWEAQGTTTAALDRLGTQVKAAQADPTGQAWKPVADKVSTVLNGGIMQGNQPVGHLPQDTSLSLKRQLETRFKAPGFHQVADGAYQGSVNTLTQLGLNNQQFAPTQAAFKQYHQAQAHLASYAATHNVPVGPPPAGSAQEMLQKRVDDGWTATSSAIQSQMETAQLNATTHGATPQARAALMSGVTQSIGISGPQTEDFKAVTAFSDWDLRVNKPAGMVQMAYDNQKDPTQGALHASDVLAGQTAAAGDPQYAAMILSRSNPTVMQIGQQAGRLASPEYNNPRMKEASPQLQQIYSSMSKATETANVINQTPLESAAVLQTGQAMVDGVAHDPAGRANPNSASKWTALAVQETIGRGDGAALGMSMALAAEGGGRGTEQGRLVDGVTNGLGDLQARTDKDVETFATTAAGLPQVLSTWDGSATPEQKQAAIAGFEAHTPGYKEQAAAVNADGVAAGQAASAWQNFGRALQNPDGHAAVATASQALTGGDTKVAAAIASSDWLSNNLQANAAARAGTMVDGVPVAYVNSDLSVLKNAKSSIKALHVLTTNKFSPTGQWLQDRANLPGTLNGGALGLAAVGGIALYATAGSLQTDPLKGLYNYLGAGKEAIEAYARISGPDSAIKPILAGLNEQTKEGLTAVKGRTAAWNGFGGLLGVFGTALDVQSAIKADKQGDTFGRNANLVAAVSDGVGALNSLTQAASNVARITGRAGAADALAGVSDGVFGTVAASSIGLGPIALATGAVALVASVVSVVHQKTVARDTLNKQSSQFLQDGLGIPSAQADALGKVATNGASPVLDSLSRQTGQSRQQLIHDLGTKDSVKLERFIERAASMAEQHPDGRYPRTPIHGRGHPSLSMNDLEAEYRGL